MTSIRSHRHLLVRWATDRDLLGKRPIVLCDAGAEGWTFGFNPLHFGSASPEEVARGVDAMIAACAQVWGGEDPSRTPLLKRCLRALFHALAEHGLTLLETVPLMSATDPSGLRHYLTSGIKHPLFREQWADFNAMQSRQFQEAFSSTNNRMVEFLHTPIVERIIGQTEHVLDFRALMDSGAQVLVNLGGARLSRGNAQLLGALLINDLFLKAQGRPQGSRPFTLYVDECHRYLNDDIAGILTETRKFGLHVVLAHQNLGQLRAAGERVYSAVRAAGTAVVFGGLSPEDADDMARTVFGGELDYETVKRRFDKPVVVGYERTRLSGGSETSGRSRGSSRTTSEATSESEGSMESSGYSSGVGGSETEDGFSVSTFHEGSVSVSGSSSSTSRARGSSEGMSDGESESQTASWSETLEPILREMPSQGYTLEELRDRAAALLRNLPRRSAVAKVGNRRSARIRVPDVEPGIARHERVEAFRGECFQLTDFTRPVSEIEAEISSRRKTLEESAKRFLTGGLEEPEDFLE